MNKTTAIIGGIVILAVIGGVVFYTTQNTVPSSDNNATSTSDNGQTTTNPVTTVSQAGLPVAVTDPTVVPTDTTAVVVGKVTPNGAFTNYWYEYGVTTDLGNKTSNQSVGSGYIAISAPSYIIGLTKDTVYYFRLVAENQYGRVAGAQYSFQTTHGNPPFVGSIPAIKTLAASRITRTSVNLNGEVNPNRAGTQYWFEYGKTTNLGNTAGFVSVGDGSTNIPASISLSNLDPTTTYYFRIDAQNQFGTVNGAILNFETTGPTAATAPSATTHNATGVAASTATLHGTVNPNGAETMYWFEYSTDSLLGSVLMQRTNQTSAVSGSNTTSVSADISGLNPNTTYYFRIAAQNSLGTVRGNRATFKTK